MNNQPTPKMDILSSDSGLPGSGAHTTTSSEHCLAPPLKPGMCVDVSTQTDLTFGQHDANIIDSYTIDISKIDTLMNHFSGLLEKAETTLEGYKTEAMRTNADCIGNSALPSAPAPQPLVISSPPTALPTPVCNLSVNFNDINWIDICKDTNFSRIGSRSVKYYGASDYGYGPTVHKAKHYPQNATIDHIFTQISEALQDPSFNKEQVTCLITKYEDGKCHIPFHSDDENKVTGDIITLSLGASRDLVFRSKVGPVKQQIHKLDHGCVYVMTRESQNFWEHGILPQPEVQDCRMSLTFRRLSQNAPPRQKIPRIHKPTHKPMVTEQPQPKERLLFLTDSLLRDLPFDLPNVQCVKREMYQLSKILEHEQYISGSKIVIISSGINDLSRYDHNHHSLSCNFKRNIDYLIEKYPNTTFIFNSLVLTRLSWLNEEIKHFNSFIFELSNSVSKLWFFDSHHICTVLYQKGETIVDPDGNGIHLTVLSKREIARCLATCVRELMGRSYLIRKHWPLRREYVSLLGRP